MNILSVLHCEIRKIIRSNVFWIMFLVLGFGPIMMGVGNVLSSDAGGVSWEQYLTGLLDTLAPLGLSDIPLLRHGYSDGNLRIEPSKICWQSPCPERKLYCPNSLSF